MGIDIGSTGIKGVLADHHGTVLFSKTVQYPISQPSLGWAEEEPELWWEGALTIFHEMLAASPAAKDSLKGIFITGMVPNLVPLDASGASIRPAILYRDNRATRECEELNHSFDLSLGMQDLLPKLFWIKKHEPDIYRKIAWVLNSHSYLVYRLTGKLSSDADIAALWGGDIYEERAGWCFDKIEELGLPKEIFPPIFYPGEVVGPVDEKIRELLGLSCSPEVLAGNGDSFSSMLGAGVGKQGDGMIYLGTAATLWHIDTDLEEIADKLIFGSDKVTFVGNVLTGGELLRWFCYGMQIDGDHLSLKELDERGASIPAGCEGLITLPHLMGKRTPEPDHAARGALIGLTSYHTAYHIYRSFLEAVAYSLYESYLASGLSLERLLITGGGASSGLWRSILASVFQRELIWYPKGDPPLGDAYFAAYRLGHFDDFSTLRDQWLGDVVITEPMEGDIGIYQERFKEYLRLDQSIYG